jgi:hypothetical protein
MRDGRVDGYVVVERFESIGIARLRPVTRLPSTRQSMPQDSTRTSLDSTDQVGCGDGGRKLREHVDMIGCATHREDRRTELAAEVLESDRDAFIHFRRQHRLPTARCEDEVHQEQAHAVRADERNHLAWIIDASATSVAQKSPPKAGGAEYLGDAPAFEASHLYRTEL